MTADQERRLRVIDKLQNAYLNHFVEDGRDGTDFDCYMLDMFEEAKKRSATEIKQERGARLAAAATTRPAPAPRDCFHQA